MGLFSEVDEKVPNSLQIGQKLWTSVLHQESCVLCEHHRSKTVLSKLTLQHVLCVQCFAGNIIQCKGVWGETEDVPSTTWPAALGWTVDGHD